MDTLVPPSFPQLIAALLAGALWAWPQTAPTPRAQANRLIQKQILDLNGRTGNENNGAQLGELLRQRAVLLTELMEKDPGAAVESALPERLREELASGHPEVQPWLEEKGEWTGPLVIAIADDFAHHRGRTIQTLRVQGHLFTLYWDSPPDATCARSATVRGIRLGHRMAAASVVVTPDTDSPCSTTGNQKTAVLMVNYLSTQITSGYTPEFLYNAFFGPAPSLTDYWQDASYGTTSASGDVFGPFNLAQDFECDQQDDILEAAIAAADSTVDFTAYQRIYLILPLTVSGGCVYDGIAHVGCALLQSPSKGPFTASVTWLETPTLGPNIYGALGEFPQTLIHEGGHNFGLRHANSLDYDTLPIGAVDSDGVHTEYGDNFSSMGSYPGHFAAPHKSMLGWLSEGAGYQTVESPGTWTLSPLSSQSGSLYALRVARGTGTDQWLWMEYRQPIGSYEPSILDNGAPRNFNGVLVHLEDPNQSANWPAYTNELTFEPVQLRNDFNKAMLEAGTTWSDPYTNLTLTIGSAAPTGIPVTVSYDNGCATLTSSSQAFGAAGGSGEISVQAAASCAWNAARAAEWITFTGATYGTGPGVVPYSVLANSSTAARSSFISISHQTFSVSQPAQTQAGSVAVTPASGTGASETFSFQFTDPSSWKNLTWGEININTAQLTANSCYIHWDAAGNKLSLRDNGDDSWLGPVAVGSSGMLANGQCVLHPETATLVGSGGVATLRLQVDFTNRFANNTDNIYMQEQSQATACGWHQAGTWVISFAFKPVSVSPSNGSGSEQLFTFTIDGFYPPSADYDGDEVDLAFTTSKAFGTLQFYDHGCAMPYFGNNNIVLYGDTVSTNNAPRNGTLGSGGSIANSQCTLNLANSSASLNGSTLTLNLALSFSQGFDGTQSIYVFGPGTGWPLGASYAPLGAYTVTAPACASPVFSAPGGTYPAPQKVAITDATNGAVIYYTTDGSTPTTSSAKYTGPITVSASETVQAIAVASGFTASAVASATYTITLPAATPAFSVPAGTYPSTQTVTISDATSGATIYYTTNGASPTTSSAKYTGPITVSSSETVQAMAVASGFTASAVASATYTITLPAATPAFSVPAGTYPSTQTVTITDATSGAVIYYTTNGTAPTTSSAKYTGPITVSSSETIEAMAVASGFTASAVASATYTITPPAATPVFSVSAGTYTSTQTVTISDATGGVIIYFTTNGTAPTTSSAKYTAPITVSSSETIEAVAVASGFTASAVASATYTITPPAATPAFSVPAGTYTSTQTVTITDATSGATIYYTTNGSAPTTSSSKYTGPITVSSSETIEAVAVASGFTASAVAWATYTITPPAATPVFSIKPGSYGTGQKVAITDATSGAIIYYTTNGTTPTTKSTKYTGAISVSVTETIQAIAVASGYATSAVASATYTIR